MFDLRRLLLIAGFELKDALRSRLALIVGLVFSGGSALATWIFIRGLQASEKAARTLIASQSQVAPEQVPMEEIRAQAISGLIEFWTEDEALRQSIGEIEPVAIFFGFAALLMVPFLVLALSAGAHAADIQSGSARFVLFRADRGTWALGKMLGHLLLLAVGLALAATVTGVLSLLLQEENSPRLFVDLGVGAMRALLYGGAYLAVFSGLTLVAAAPLRARALCLFALLASAVGHAVTSADWFAEQVPAMTWSKWLFLGQYKMGLWHEQPLSLGGSLLGLALIGAAGFTLGQLVFMRRDA